MNLIEWDGKWTGFTLVKFADDALRKAFPLSTGIKLRMGFKVTRKDSMEPYLLSATDVLHRNITISGQTEKHGKATITLLVLIEPKTEQMGKHTFPMDIHVPVSIKVSHKGQKASFEIKQPEKK